MQVKDLRAALDRFRPDCEVFILDGLSGPPRFRFTMPEITGDPQYNLIIELED